MSRSSATANSDRGERREQRFKMIRQIAHNAMAEEHKISICAVLPATTIRLPVCRRVQTTDAQYGRLRTASSAVPQLSWKYAQV